MTRTEYFYVLTDQLTIVFIRCEHICFVAFFASLGGKCSNDIVSLEIVDKQAWDVHCLEYLFYDRYCLANVLRSLLTLAFILRKSLVSECFTRVESHSDMRRFLLCDYLVQSVHEAHNG